MNNTNGSYTCQCLSDFESDLSVDSIRSCSDIVNCGVDDLCNDESGFCSETPGSYVCSCLNGMSLSGEFDCVDENECATGHLCDHDCFNNIPTHDNTDLYSCGCHIGHTLQENG